MASALTCMCTWTEFQTLYDGHSGNLLLDTSLTGLDLVRVSFVRSTIFCTCMLLFLSVNFGEVKYVVTTSWSVEALTNIYYV